MESADTGVPGGCWCNGRLLETSGAAVTSILTSEGSGASCAASYGPGRGDEPVRRHL